MTILTASGVLVISSCSTGGDEESTAAATVESIDGDSIAADTASTPPAPPDAAPPGSVPDDGNRPPPPGVGGPPELGRVDLQTTGNRVIEGSGLFTSTEPIEVPFEATAAWIVAAPGPEGGTGWLVAMDDGTAVFVDDTGIVTNAPPVPGDPTQPPQNDPRRPVLDSGGSAFELPDTRIRGARVVHSGDLASVLTDETDRYPHAVVGDEFEGGSITIVRSGEPTAVIFIDEPDVVEAVSPLLADVDADGSLDVLATLSNAQTGARLVVFDTDGELLAESEPVGRGNRWRNLLAVAPIGPDGELEVIDVQTPHIGGILQFHQLQNGRLARVAAASTDYSTHSIGSENLDLGIVSDADGDGRLDVMLPTQDQSSIAVVRRTNETETGTEEIFRFDLRAGMTTNLGARQVGDGVAYAIGTRDNRLLIWPAG